MLSHSNNPFEGSSSLYRESMGFSFEPLPSMLEMHDISGFSIPATPEERRMHLKPKIFETMIHESMHFDCAKNLIGLENVTMVSALPKLHYEGVTVFKAGVMNKHTFATIAGASMVVTADNKPVGTGGDQQQINQIAQSSDGVLSTDHFVNTAREALNKGSAEVRVRVAEIAAYLQSVYPKDFPVISGNMLQYIYTLAYNEVSGKVHKVAAHKNENFTEGALMNNYQLKLEDAQEAQMLSDAYDEYQKQKAHDEKLNDPDFGYELIVPVQENVLIIEQKVCPHCGGVKGKEGINVCTCDEEKDKKSEVKKEKKMLLIPMPYRTIYTYGDPQYGSNK